MTRRAPISGLKAGGNQAEGGKGKAMTRTQKQPEQLYFNRTEPPLQEPDPDLVPEIDELVRDWLDAKAATKDATDAKAEGEHRLMVELAERGLERYPYTDPVSGKRRYFVAEKG